jgi:predicted HTH transcriptional regulator
MATFAQFHFSIKFLVMESIKSFVETIGELIGKDELALAIKNLYALLKDSPKLDEAILQSARYNDVIKQIRLGIVDFEQANITKNQIRYALLDLLRDIEEQEQKQDINVEIQGFLSRNTPFIQGKNIVTGTVQSEKEIIIGDNHKSSRITIQSVDNIFTNEHAPKTEYDVFVEDIKKHQHNQFSTTSERLVGKTIDFLDTKQLKKLFSQTLVKEHFKQYKIKKNEELGVKLKALQLITNGYVIKGTFLCLASIDNLRSVTRVAYESRFFTFRDVERMNTKVVQLVAGSLIQQFQQIIDHIMNNLYLHRDLDTRTSDYEIPEKVFTELLANAFIHANYADDAITGIKVEILPDRMVFYNPGVIQENILQNLENNELSYIVNPEITKIFFLYEFVETAGSGIARVQKILKDNGMLPAKIEQKTGYVTVTVFKHKKPYFDPILALEKAYQFIDNQQIAEFFVFIEKHTGDNETLTVLQKQFIEGASDALFFNRLKAFAANALKNN